MGPGPWKPRQEPTAVEGTVAHWTCIPDVWAMEDTSCFFGRIFPLEQQPGGPVVCPCLFPQRVSARVDAVPAPRGDSPERGQPREGGDGCGGHEMAAAGCVC